MENGNGHILIEDEWKRIREIIDDYRSKIPQHQRTFNPLFYFIIDHSGQHGPSSVLLKDYISFCGRRSSRCTCINRIIKKLIDIINDSVDCPNKDDVSEYEHMMRNIVPFIDATINKVPEYRIRYFESTLHATAIRRNMGGDPTECARIGYKVDVLIKLPGLHWSPDIGCGEISGGLPRCTRVKEWMDTLKLGLELRDVWILANNQLCGVDTNNLVIWGFTVVARSIRIYALAIAGGLIHLILAYEAPIPSARWNRCNAKIAYCTMLEFLKKLNDTKILLLN
ncbi:hypothetical protein RclHR1_04130011 [Rhizophagus clarus]|uniref:Uncharacterized protein n=1 Tax=Rhizophagus clarus TaxID=94130 RepID=A0A2Z6RSS8_9GLOM|nr:hypothetical protein RclHR1_04130011 [Rhizophagus clarus]